MLLANLSKDLSDLKSGVHRESSFRTRRYLCTRSLRTGELRKSADKSDIENYQKAENILKSLTSRLKDYSSVNLKQLRQIRKVKLYNSKI